MKNKKLKYIIIGILALIVIISLRTINENRERNFDDLIPYKHRNFETISFRKEITIEDTTRAADWVSRDQDQADELMNFLSQYRLKKISNETFNERLSDNEEGIFDFFITHSRGTVAIVNVQGDVVHIFGNYYEVLNGPIDMEWISKFDDKNEKKYTPK